MKKIAAIMVIMTLIMQLLPTAAIKAQAESAKVTLEQEKPNKEGYFGFSFNLFNKVALKGDENALISPASAYFALAMVANGAKNDTKKAFENVLGMPVDELNVTCRKLINDLQKTQGDTTLNIADSVWTQNNFLVPTAFTETLKKFYDAEMFQEDLSSVYTMNKINDWVNNKTNRLIPKLLEEPLSADAIMLLLNTVYLKAKWRNVFNADKTFKGTFVKEDGTKATVPFLKSDEERWDYFINKNVEGIVLPYNDDELEFIAIRPRDGKTVNQFASELNANKFCTYRKMARKSDVILSMPKFTLDYTITMNDVLSDMGLSAAFDCTRADFSNIGKELFISKVLQKTKMEVNENGTEAAAVTAIVVEKTSFIEEIVRFDLNSPYVYAVVDKESGFPLFIGIMNNPK